MATQVLIDGTLAETTYVSSTQVVATTPASEVTGPVDVAVMTSAGQALLPDAFTYVDQPNVALHIPPVITVAVGDPTPYLTRLTNFGTAVDDPVIEIRLTSTEPLSASDITYETRDTDVWQELELMEDSVTGELFATELLGWIGPNQDSPSTVRITVHRDVGELGGLSTIRDPEGFVLASAVYEYAIQAVA